MFQIGFDDAGTIVIAGRLDAAQAPRAQEFLDSIADGVQNSILCREETPFDSYERFVEVAAQMPPQIARASLSSVRSHSSGSR